MEPSEFQKEMARQAAERTEKARAAFPYRIIEVPGGDALAAFEALTEPGRIHPVILGAPEAAAAALIPFEPGSEELFKTDWNSEAARAEADRLTHPDDIRALRIDEYRYSFDTLLKSDSPPLRAQAAEALRLLEQEGEAAVFAAPDGDWPSEPRTWSWRPPYDDDADAPDMVAIALVETDDPTTVPIHMRYGAWNACPPAPYHTAALRAWRDQFGAELVAMSHSTLELRVARRPADRAEATALAWSQQVYCADLAFQSYGSIADLAASLLESDWWLFWWD